MFRCEKCQKVSQPREPVVRVVVERREREGRGGWEIAREEIRHAACAEEATEAALAADAAVQEGA